MILAQLVLMALRGRLVVRQGLQVLPAPMVLLVGLGQRVQLQIQVRQGQRGRAELLVQQGQQVLLDLLVLLALRDEQVQQGLLVLRV